MSKPKFPAQVFVVSKKVEENEYINGDYSNPIKTYHNFGFMHRHELNLSADAKRKDTQMSWAYEGIPYVDMLGNWCHRGAKWNYQTCIRDSFDQLIDPLYAPKVWDNDPIDGFTIIDTVNRYRGNKSFKVLDPRGIEFEITVKSLFEIVSAGRIDKGRILDKCIWYSNKDLRIA